MTTQVILTNVRSIQLSDIYANENQATGAPGAGELMRTLRIQSDEGEIRILLCGQSQDNILLSYPKR